MNNSANDINIENQLKKWNWGAFFLTWMWGLGNDTYIGLLSILFLTFLTIASFFLPIRLNDFIGYAFLPFILLLHIVHGLKGNRWSWRNRKWQSYEGFRIVQRRWAIAGFTLWLLLMLLGFFVYFMFKTISSDFKLFEQQTFPQEKSLIEKNKAIQQILGSPIHYTKVVELGRDAKSKEVFSFSPTTYYIRSSMNPEKNTASNSFYIKGPKAQAQVFANSIKVKDKWMVTKITINMIDVSAKKIIVNAPTQP